MRYFITLMLLALFVAPSLAMTEKSKSEKFTKQSLTTLQVKEFESALFQGKLEVSISLPKSYLHSTKKYPVIYALDGEFLMPTVINIANVRASRDLMPESIIVGLKTSGKFNRLSITLPIKREAEDENVIFANAKPIEFLSFLNSDLLPYINEHYRTARHNTIIGMSPTSGLVLADYFSSQPLFNAHIALAADPQNYTKSNEALTEIIVQNAKAHKNSRLYISRGELDFKNSKNKTKQNAFKSLKENIKSHDLSKQLAVDIIAGGEHYAASLVSINNGFGFVYPEDIWRPQYLTIRSMVNPTEELKNFYQNLSKQYGFTTYPTIEGYWMGMSITGTVRYLLRNEQHAQAISLLQWALVEQPKNVSLHYYLAATYEENKNLDKAIQAVNDLVNLAKKQSHKSLSYYQKYQEELLKNK